MALEALYVALVALSVTREAKRHAQGVAEVSYDFPSEP